MEIKLPMHFVRRVNMLDEAFIDYQSSYRPDQKDDARTRIFVLSCEMMNSLDIEGLQADYATIHKDAAPEDVMGWHDPSFDEFLDLENSIFEKIGIDKSVRSRICEYITALNRNRKREPSVTALVPPLPTEIAAALLELKAEVCRLARITIAKKGLEREKNALKAQNKTWREKMTNIACSTMGVAVTVANIGAGISGFMSADVAGYSVDVGAVLLAFRK